MINKIRIVNFRSIQNLEIHPHNLCVLIGPNSSGKTNVLKALDILLGETYPTERAFSKDDFYGRNSNLEILIQVWFKEPLEACKLTSVATRRKEQCLISSLRLTHTKNDNEFFQTKFIAIDVDGNEYWASGDVREKVNFIYIPSERNLEKQMSVSQWSLLGRILRKIDENFRKNSLGDGPSEMEEDFRESMSEPKRILEAELPNGMLSYAKFKQVFTGICKENANGLANDFDLDLEIYDPLFYYKTIQLLGREEMGTFNIHELGSGVQNLVLLSLFRTYAKLMKNKAVLAIEEPEIYLYPQAQRQLYSNFIGMAYPESGSQDGTQIIYTTHNPNFVDATRANEVEILQKSASRGTCLLPKSEYVTSERSEQDRFKTYAHFNTERNEIFFAKKVLLVEGDSDKIMWSTLLGEKWEILINKEGISIIECGGKTGVLYFIGVCRFMGIDYFAIWDADNGDDEVNDRHGLFSATISEGRGLEIPGNLEQFLSSKFDAVSYPQFVFSQSNKIEHAFEWANSVNISDIPEEFLSIKNFFMLAD